jgi:hypothetical protein
LRKASESRADAYARRVAASSFDKGRIPELAVSFAAIDNVLLIAGEDTVIAVHRLRDLSRLASLCLAIEARARETR